MKRIIILIALTIFSSLGFSLKVSSGSSIQNNAPTDKRAPIAMNQMPVSNKSIKQEQPIDQPKQQEQLVGSDASTWTPSYLKVKEFKKCLDIQDYRGWEGYCLPKNKPEGCPDTSWEQLAEMNLIPCSDS